MKKEIKTIFLALSILLVSFVIFNSHIVDFLGKATINTKATSGSLSVSIIINIKESNVTTDSSGEVIITEQALKSHIHKLTGLNENDKMNITFLESSYPTTWTQTAPSTGEVKSSLKYFEINFSSSSSEHTGDFRIYFNVTQEELGGIKSEDVRLFVYDDAWKELSTVVVDSSDTLQFYGITTHFSRFIVGETTTTSGSSGGGISSATGGSSGGGGTGISSEVVKESEEKPEPIKIVGNLFDISLFIPEKYAELFPGEELISEVKIINIKRTGLVNINLEYRIEDNDENLIYKEYQAEIFDSKIDFLKRIRLPSNLEPGYYMLIVKLQDQSDTAISGYPFKVKEIYEKKDLSLAFLPNVLLIFFGVVLLIFIIYKIFKKRKKTEIKLRKDKLYKELKGAFNEKKR